MGARFWSTMSSMLRRVPVRTFTRNFFNPNFFVRFATASISLINIFALLVWTSITWSGAWRVHPEGRISEEGGARV